jgi:cyclase
MTRFSCLAIVTLAAISASAQTQPPASGEVHTLHVQGNVYMLVGAGGNITVQIGPQGVLVVDTGTAQMSGQVLAAVRKLSDKPIRYILNTHVHPDHTGGNQAIAGTGAAVTDVPVVNTPGTSATQIVQILAHENVLDRMSAAAGSPGAQPMPTSAWPSDTFVNDEKEVYFNGEATQMFHPSSAAHTDGDSIVFFRRSDVISAGDLFVTTSYPVIDLARGGNVQGVIDGLNLILDLAIPAHEQEGGTYIIPGHGRLCDEADVVEYRDMVTIIRDRIRDAMKRGLTLDQVKAARLTLDYDARYGAAKGPWTTDMFVEAVYKSLEAKEKGAKK